MELGSNFIYDIIDADLAAGFDRKIVTRFPPEPNGYLHIGSAKAIWINYSLAKKYGGQFNLRYDDTNPLREDEEYVKSIEQDLLWLGAVPDGGVYYGSDYFERCYEYAEQLILKGRAYVDDLSQEEIREYRGTLTQPGRPSPCRERSAEESLDLFRRMREGEFEDGSRTLRARINMSSSNMNMRDPVLYRILHAWHHRTEDKWCIYPMYDFAHPVQDAIEGITHSLCSIEFENHRPLYNWVVNMIDFKDKPRQFEFARLNITHTVMSKRYLRELVETKTVDGWDDPRMPTLSALRRRGYTPSSIIEFVKRAGVAKAYSTVDIRLLEYCIREELNASAQRRMAVLDPIKVTITNYPEDKEETFSIANNPLDEAAGVREVSFCGELYIEREDFAEVPPPKWQRLRPDGEVRLMGSYIIRCNEVRKNEQGEVTELFCTADLETRNRKPVDGRKVKGTIHWVSRRHAIDAEACLYENLFTLEDVNDVPEGTNYLDYLNPESLVHRPNCKLEACLADVPAGERYQFVRMGYFCKDSKKPNTFNRIVKLKDSFTVND
ncbi:glutamine--tRNA ligase/YqeY domain fusion protein [Ruminococcaceae bacterium OttesenSCG-928-I18]|nr:glutamine--tRNA ligase/YqeY domain fusion protein [Ruminococcaceae bacterium OttesenSCG-928-I18]